MDRFIRFVFAVLSIAICASSVDTAAPSDNSAGDVAQSLLEAFSASLAIGNTTNSEYLVASNLDKLRSALNISLPSAGLMNSSAMSNLTATIKTFLSSEAARNTSSSLVKAASGLAETLISGGSSIITSSFQAQLKDFKARYQAAIKYLRVDDAVRIGGYLATLESLSLSAISAYPIASASLLISELALCSAITGLVGNILTSISQSLGLSGSLVSLQLTLQSVFPNGQPSGPGSFHRSADNSATFHGNTMVDSMATNADETNKQLLALALGGGLFSPLSLATNILTSSSTSLDRLSTFTAPQNLLNRLNLLQLQAQTGPLAQAFSASDAGSSGSPIGLVAAAAANLAGLGGRR